MILIKYLFAWGVAYCLCIIFFSLCARLLEWLDIQDKAFYIVLTWVCFLFVIDAVWVALEIVLYGSPKPSDLDAYLGAIVATIFTWRTFK